MFKSRSYICLSLLATCHELYAAPKGTSAGSNKPAVEAGLVPPAPYVPTAAVTGTAAAFSDAFSYEIEDNVPLPQKRVGVKGQSAYPYLKMGVNQSFFVPVSDKMKEPWKTLTSLSSRMSRDNWPLRFVTERQKDKSGVEGVRVWRIVDGTGDVPEKRKSPAKKPADVVAGAAGPAKEAPHFDGDTTTGATPGAKVDAASDPTT